jgi:hypothetical protein
LQYFRKQAALLKSVLVIMFCLSLLTLKGVSANTVTPSHVFQVALDLEAELHLLHKASYSAPSVYRVKVEARQPRHVYQKAREAYTKVQQLKFIHGLNARPIPTIPTEEVTPSDVKGIVTQVLFEIRTIKQRIGVEWQIEHALLPQGKKPTDVYVQMNVVSSLISQLDIPSVLPNEVYQVALSMIDALQSIHTKKGTGKQFKIKHTSSHKAPADVYQVVVRLYPLLNQLCESSKTYCIKGGAIQPFHKKNKIAPSNVLAILNDLFADVASIKVAIGDNSPTNVAEQQSGKTPSNVYDALIIAEKMILALM